MAAFRCRRSRNAAGLGAHLAVLVHVGMALHFRGAGAAERDAGGELRFQELPVADLVGARHDAAGRGADRRAIVVEADAA